MTYQQAQDAFIAGVNKLSYSYSKYDVFSDFCELAAIALYQPFKVSEELEKKYLNTVSKYKNDEANAIAELLGYVVQGLSDRFGDFLGECFMQLELGNKQNGQFFTPYYISKMMNMLTGDEPKEIETVCDPACGSSGIIIARADILKEKGINYQQIMEVQVTDISKICFYMSYIHLTLLHIPAEVVWGNSLSLEVFDAWYTPAYIMKAANRQNITIESIDKEVILPDDNIVNKPIYTEEETKIFATGKLFA